MKIKEQENNHEICKLTESKVICNTGNMQGLEEVHIWIRI